jgi:hypothetical protein
MSQRIIERAWRAYLATEGVGAHQPDASSGVEIINGLRYVALRNQRGVVAAYRLTNRSKLRRLKHWPLALNSVGRASGRGQVDSVKREAVPA